MENPETVQTITSDSKERRAWYLFDFANTSFTVLIVTALFPIFFTAMVEASTGDAAFADAIWGYAGSITMLVIAVTSPILGAIADSAGSKKKFLIFYTAMCVFFNGLLFFTTMDAPPVFGLPIWIWAWIVFILANIGFQGAIPFYNAWLPEISDERNVGRISGYGYAAGYVGAMFTILITIVAVFALWPSFSEPPSGFAGTLPFLLSAIFFLLFSIPSIRGLKDRPGTKKPDEEGMSYSQIGFTRIRRTFRELKAYQGISLFLVAYFLFSDAITTVIYYGAIFGEEVYGFDVLEILIFFAVVQLAAIPGAFIFGYIADRINTKPTLMITLVIWIIALIIAFFGTDPIVYWITGMLAGVGMGSAQSTARSMYGQYIPEEKKSEMFGFYALTGKFAAILGPLIYGLVLTLSGLAGLAIDLSHRYAMLSILAFFVISLIILVKVKQPVMGASSGVHLEDDIGLGM